MRISSLPAKSGRSTTTWRSNRPGRSNAASNTSGRLVAAIRMMPVLPSKPSISVNNWLSVCSRSSLPPPKPAPRWRPTASISSMNTMQGALDLACSNKSRTREAPTPTNISTNSEPEIEKKGTPASPATARASRVLPVPGGPTSSTPLGIFAPTAVKRSAFLRKSTTSFNSSFAWSMPATSPNVTWVCGSICTLALDLPKFIAWLPGPLWARRSKKNKPTKSRTGTNKLLSALNQKPSSV